jgi:hypothetical protein
LKLQSILLKHKPAILQKWLRLLLDTYPSETSTLLKKNKDPFGNPMAHTFSQEIDALFDDLLQGSGVGENAVSCLDRIVRIRAVQEFSPAQAVSFIFLLKKVVRDELEDQIRENGIYQELLDFESRIDDLALSAFDIYMKCREKIYELKANEVKARTYTLLKRANMLCEVPGT